MAAPAIPQQQDAQRTRSREVADRQWPWWLDPMLSMYLVIMLAALAITSHGTKTFYAFMLGPFLAYSATIVLALGIPVLEFGAIMAPKGKRAPFVSGVVFLVLIETLANYFQAQAGFMTQISKQFSDPAGIDLATFANQPHGRLLPILFLSAQPLIVLGAGFAATQRWKELRATRPQSGATDEQRLAEVITPYMATIDKLKQQVADLGKQLTTAMDDRKKAIDAAVNLKREMNDLAQRPAVTDGDILQALASGQWKLATIAQRLSTAGMGSGDIAQRLGTSRQAVDNWLKKGGE